MKSLFLLQLFLLSFACLAFCQSTLNTSFNFDLEKIDLEQQLPQGWVKEGTHFRISLDSLIKHGGKYALRIEPDTTSKEDEYGGAVYKIPFPYEGNTLELQASMRIEAVTEGFAGLLLSLMDENGGNIDFENMEETHLEGTKDWQRYRIRLPLAEETHSIYLGAFLTGKGKVWVDDFKLLVDGKDLSQASAKQVRTFKAQFDTAFDKGSNMPFPTLTPLLIEHLTLLGKVWGFVKYYHPAVAAGDYNWDYELFRMLSPLLTATSTEDRDRLLSQWVAKLGPIKPGKEEASMDSLEAKLEPDLAWLEDQALLGTGLQTQLRQIQQANRTNSHYYIGLAPKVGNPIFKHEAGYFTMLHPDAGYRLLALFRYWNMIEYFFPYKHLITEDWNGVLKEFIPKMVQATTALNYQLSLLELITKIGDTHANLWGQGAVIDSYKGINYAPLELSFVEEKALITGYFDPELGKQTGLKKGDIILEINNEKVEAIIKRKLPLTPASNYATKLSLIAREILRTNDNDLHVSYKRGSKTRSALIRCYSPQEVGLYKMQAKQDTCAKLVAEKIGYIYAGNIKNDYLPTIMSSFKDTKGIIIDLRCYPSDFIVFTLGGYLMEKPIEFVKFTAGNLQKPGLFTFTPALKVGKYKGEYYKGKVVILVNEKTLSQAEYTTMALRAAPRATVMGSTTAAADGNVSQISLPGGLYTMISGIGIYYPDGRETQRIGMVPDIEVKPTIKGVRAGRDEVLEKAIEYISNHK